MEELPKLTVKKKEPEDPERREKLLKMASAGEIDKTVEYIRKANTKTINKLWQLEEERRETASKTFCSEFIIKNYAMLLGKINLIEDQEALYQELADDPLLRKDVDRLSAILAPYIPCLGIVSGAVTTGKHYFLQSGAKPSHTSSEHSGTSEPSNELPPSPQAS